MRCCWLDVSGVDVAIRKSEGATSGRFRGCGARLPMAALQGWVQCQTKTIGISPDDDAKMTIRAAVRYLIKGATGGARGDIVQGIISIVRQAVHDLPDQPDPCD